MVIVKKSPQPVPLYSRKLSSGLGLDSVTEPDPSVADSVRESEVSTKLEHEQLRDGAHAVQVPLHDFSKIGRAHV